MSRQKSQDKRQSVPARYRWSVASRVLAAICGGYALAALLSTVMALVLPRISEISRADAVLISTLLSFVVYTVVVLWVFCARTALRSWLWLVAVGLIGMALLQGLRSIP